MTSSLRTEKLEDVPLLRLLKKSSPKISRKGRKQKLRVAGLFAGIGGIELGLAASGHKSELLCEIDPGAQAILRDRFRDTPIHDDVRTLESLPRLTELVTAGFPCQDLSQAGKTVGIEGSRSGLVGEVFRLIKRRTVPWLLIENVPFMLQLSQGRALDVIISTLEDFGYRWAYRIVDARSFGIPQRRERVYILASLEHDPRAVLLVDDVGAPPPEKWEPGRSFGFYWTEGVRGLGAAVDAVPTLKGGSTIGIPSPPAIILPNGSIIVPDIRDAERLQGFAQNWTKGAEKVVKRGLRWKYVGNAVAVHVAKWIGERLRDPGSYDPLGDAPMRSGIRWPRAAWNIDGQRHEALVSSWPRRTKMVPIHEFLHHPGTLLSLKATAGFLRRTETASLRFPPGFLPAVEAHLLRMEGMQAAA